MENINKPYVKQYDEKGLLINPITKNEPYLHEFKNGFQRRQNLKESRFFTNRKTCPILVIGKFKFKKVQQFTFHVKGENEGKLKIINHYLPVIYKVKKKDEKD